jgi:hypothetical protein
MCVLALVLEMPSKLPLKPQTPALHYAEINKAAQQSREPEQQEIVKVQFRQLVSIYRPLRNSAP